MEFTKPELYEIEKRFDRYAGETAHGMALLIDRMSSLPEGKEFVRKILSEVTTDYDMYRSISAKAKIMRDGGESNEPKSKM